MPSCFNMEFKKQKIVSGLLGQNILVTGDVMAKLENTSVAEGLFLCIEQGGSKDSLLKILNPPQTKGKVEILFSYKDKYKKREVQDFVKYFNKRYKFLEGLLRNRHELRNTTSISRILQKKEREAVALIGIVTDKKITKNGNVLLTAEDPTGTVRVIISKSREDIFGLAKDIVYDEVIGITGTSGDKIIFANNIVLPDVPLTHELKKAPTEGYACFISCVHVGSGEFLGREFEKFIRWLHGEVGNEKQRDMAKKMKYIFILGDLVDGIGIYPGQENELEDTDIYSQYKEFARYMDMIPKHINIIICPGNHDATRIAEPQVPVPEEFTKDLRKIENVILVSNPAVLRIERDEKFEGLNVLIYHGFSFDYYAANVESIRMAGSYERGDLIMKFLLQRRHLAPAHTSTLYIPDIEKDPLVIQRVPDIFATGHIHRCSAASYRNVSLLSAGCWQAITAFQVKTGHKPQPCRVPVVNLQTRAVKILNFTL